MLALDTENKSSKVSEVLKEYIDGGVIFMNDVKSGDAKAKAKEYTNNTDKSAFKDMNKDDLKSAIVAKEKFLKEELSTHPMRDAMDYYTNSSLYFKKEEVTDDMIKSGILAIGGCLAATCATPSTLETTAITSGAFLVGAAACFGKAVVKEKLSCDNVTEQFSIQEYSQLKHAQLVLKQLKKSLGIKSGYMADVENLMAAGYGQPSGGFVQAADPVDLEVKEPKSEGKSGWEEFKENVKLGMKYYGQYGNPAGFVGGNVFYEKTTEAPAKEDKKPSFLESLKEGWKMIGQYGNPSGGLVHSDPVMETKAAVKEEPKKESSFVKNLKEGWELIGQYGNPSGGLVHSDAIKETKAAIKEEPKKESSFMTMIKEGLELIAQYGNPSGGLVHADAVKAKAPIKEEPKKEKKSSYKDEVAALMAAGYGQPSGGLVQAALNKKKLQR